MPTANEYTIGWISALHIELVAAQVFLDEKHENLKVSPNDNNTYVLGRVGEHNVVITVLPDGEYGVTSAATVARDMLHSFPNVKLGLIVGIGGGVPSKKHDIRLGDVVVSTAHHGTGGVVQYDYGKTIQDQKFHRTGFLNQPPTALRTAISALRAHHEIEGPQLDEAVSNLLEGKQRLKASYCRPAPDTDRLYKTSIIHPMDDPTECKDSCGVSSPNLQPRHDRGKYDEDDPSIHYGLIASGSSLVKNARLRDKLSEELDVLCFEMEAAGLMNHFPCVVVRGICDYSDSHKNDKWQKYAAMIAAAYSRDLLRWISPTRVESERTISDTIEALGEGLRETRNTIHVIQKSVSSAKSDQLRTHIQDWLQPVDSSTSWNTALKLRLPGTGHTFINSKAFTQWSSQPNSFLWLYGIPGCGKTVLSATIIEQMSSQCPVVLYFYFSFSDIRLQTLDGMVRSLLFQVCQQEKRARDHVDDLFDTSYRGSKQPSTDDLCQVFAKILRDLTRVCLVLDGLDECTTRKGDKTQGVLSWIRVLLASQLTDLHLMVISRPEHDISSALREHCDPEHIISIQGDLVATDITAYIDWRIEKDKGLARWRQLPRVQQEIKNEINKRANGMFRWVALQLDALEDCLDYPTLRHTLATLPETLDDTYARIFRQIPPQRKEKAIRLLQLLSYSERPLSIEELIDAIAVDFESDPCFHPQNRMPDYSEITSYCSSFITIIERTERSHHNVGAQAAQTMLGLTHFSVKEYFTSDRLSKDLADQLHEGPSRISIARACVAYLLSLDITTPLLEIRRRFPFADYAATYWISNATVQHEEDAELYSLIMKFLLSHKTLHRIWYFLHDPDSPTRTGYNERYRCRPAPASMLYYSCLSGLTEEVKGLLEVRNSRLEEKEYGKCLLTAASQGHEGAVALLLDRGTDAHTVGDEGNALCVAALKGHDEVVRLLLRRGFDSNASGDHYGLPIRFSASKGHTNIVRMLIDRDVDVDTDVVNLHHPIYEASLNNHGSVIGLLLNASKNPRTKELRWTLALKGACWGGNVRLARMLLDQINDIYSPLDTLESISHQKSLYDYVEETECDLKDLETVLDWGLRNATENEDIYALAIRHAGVHRMEKMHGVASILRLDDVAESEPWGPILFYAIKQGNTSIVKMLLMLTKTIKRIDSWSTYSDDISKALGMAAIGGHTQVIQYLLDNGADVDTCEPMPDNAFFNARGLEHTDSVRLLLDRGATLDSCGSKGWPGNALISACSAGHMDVIRMLLDKGADVNISCEPHLSPLESTAKGGLYDAVLMLLEAGATVNTSAVSHSSALELACANGHKDIVELLLQHGAQVTSKPEASFKRSQAPLLAACTSGHREIAEILYKHGARVDVHGAEFDSVIQVACSHWNTSQIRLLLEFCMYEQSSVPDHLYFTVLVAASRHGDKEIITALLDKGVDVNGEAYAETAIIAASNKGHKNIVKLLLESGADVNAGTSTGTALHIASYNGGEEIVQFLLKAGADPNAESNTGSPLHLASLQGHTQIIESLLKAGAEANKSTLSVPLRYKEPLVAFSLGGREESAVTALDLACAKGNEESIQLLIDAGADIFQGNALLFALAYEHHKVLLMLIRQGIDIASATKGDFRVLSVAAQSGDMAVVSELLERGVRVQPFDLEHPAYRGHQGVVRMLIKECTDVNDRRSGVLIALRNAARAGRTELVRNLLDEWGYICEKDDYADALRVAVGNGHERMVATLLQNGADANVRHTWYGCRPSSMSVLEYACAAGRRGIAMLLVEAGADIDFEEHDIALIRGVL